jgi:hypothetical protein
MRTITVLLIFICFSNCSRNYSESSNWYRECVNSRLNVAQNEFFGKEEDNVNFFEAISSLEKILVDFEMTSKKVTKKDFWSLLQDEDEYFSMIQQFLAEVETRHILSRLECTSLSIIVISECCCESFDYGNYSDSNSLFFKNQLIFEHIQKYGYENTVLFLMLNLLDEEDFKDPVKRAPFIFMLYKYWQTI